MWTVPLVQSLSSPAYATGSDRPCGDSFYFVFTHAVNFLPRPVGIETWQTGPEPLPVFPCSSPGFTTAEHPVPADNGSSRSGSFSNGAASGTVSVAVVDSRVTVTLSSNTGCRLAAMMDSGNTCTALVEASPGVYTATVPDQNYLRVAALICC